MIDIPEEFSISNKTFSECFDLYINIVSNVTSFT